MTPFPRRLTALLFTLLMLMLAATAVQAREMVSAVRDGVMLRTGPSPRAPATWSVVRGYPLEVLGRKGAWLRVRDFENDRAWVLSSRTGRRAHMVSTARALNVRSTPAPRGRIVAKAGYGDVLRTLERRGEWVKVRTDRGANGWVPRKRVWGW